MKSYIIALTTALAVASAIPDKAQLTDEQKARVLLYTADCMLETGVSPEAVFEARKGKYSEDETFKKFTLCFFKKSGIFNSKGVLDVDVALSKLPSSVDKGPIRKVLEECKKKKGTNAADTAFEVFKCYKAGTPTHVASF